MKYTHPQKYGTVTLNDFCESEYIYNS